MADEVRTKHAGGRPTKYSPEMVTKAIEYLESCVDEEIQQVVGLSAKGTELYKNKLKVHFPTIEGLSLYLGVNKSTVYDWETQEPEFSYVLGNIRSEQASRLMENALAGDYNPTISKLLLIKHGYVDRHEVTGENGTEIKISIAPEILKRYSENDTAHNAEDSSSGQSPL